VVALWATGLSLGLTSRVADFLAPLRNASLVIKVLVLDVLAVPLLVWGLVNLFDLPKASATGLLIVGVASAGPLGITACRIAGGDARAALSFVVVLEAANAVVIPVWFAVLLPAGVHVSLGSLIVTLVLLVLAPLAVGLAIRARRGMVVQRWSPVLATISSLLVVVLVATVLVRYGSETVKAIKQGAATVAGLTVLTALAAGWVVGRPKRTLRIAVAMVTGVRANGLALAIAQASYPSEPLVHAAVATAGLFSIVLPVALAFGLAARARDRRAAR
jgi:BASS family bile acid:Na+ symporter